MELNSGNGISFCQSPLELSPYPPAGKTNSPVDFLSSVFYLDSVRSTLFKPNKMDF